MREYTFSYWFGSAYGWWRWMDVIWMEETAGWSRDYSTARLPDSQARRGQGRFVTDPAPPAVLSTRNRIAARIFHQNVLAWLQAPGIEGPAG